MPMLDTTEETPATPPVVDSAAVRTRAVSGVKALTARTLASVLLRAVSSLTLARLLFPRDYGVFAIAAYITGLGMFLCDVGLGGALVRQTEEPSPDESFTVFWSQQAITALVVFAVIATAPWLEVLYRLPPSALALLVVMACGLFFSSLRVMPMMALEREMRFPVIARCELTENVAQTVGTIALAALGCGPWALAGGGLIRGVVGLACIWSASPWRPQGRFRWEIVKRLARYGIPFQLNALVPTFVGGWMPLVVGRILGVAAVGLTGWATNIASVPLLLSTVFNRVAFPAYSRLQSDPAAFSHYLRSSLRRLSAVLCLVVPLMVIVSPVAIPLIFGRRWAPAVPLVQWFSLEIVLLTLNGILCAVQNAIGYPGDRLGVAVGTGLLRWVLGYLGVRCFGLVGVGIAMCLVSAVELGLSLVLVGHRHTHCRKLVMDTFGRLLAAGLMLGVAVAAGNHLYPGLPWHRAAAAAILFLGMIGLREWLTGGHIILAEWRRLAAMVKRPAYEGSGV